MVLLQFTLSATLQNVSKVYLPLEDSWHMVIKCTACNTKWDNEVVFSINDKVEVIKEEVNFSGKCKSCGRKGTIDISKQSTYCIQLHPEKEQEEQQVEQGKKSQIAKVTQSLLILDCRGLEVLQLVLGNSLYVESTSGSVFQNIDLNDDLWAEYDDKLGELCQIQGVQIKITRK